MLRWRRWITERYGCSALPASFDGKFFASSVAYIFAAGMAVGSEEGEGGRRHDVHPGTL